jgi:quercetin dioxygenase-like cupin family protein
MRAAATTMIFAVLCVCSTQAAAVHSANSTPTSAGPAKEAVTVTPADMKWVDAPPSLPKGASMAVLHGDPAKKGVFTLRFKTPNGYQIPPHWHTNDEQLTVISGTFVVHMGDTMDAPAHELVAGSYHFLPGKLHHAAEAKGENTVVQVDGMGPFDIHYLNPAENPNRSASR